MKARIEEDPDTGDFVLILPEELIEEWQLEPGDLLTFKIEPDGSVIITY